MESDRKRKLKRQLGYGAGYLPDACFYQFIASYQMLFLTGVVGMSAAAAGTVSSVTIMADALAGLFIGRFSDNLRSRFGRRRPLLIASGIIMPLAFTFMFSKVGGGESYQLLYYMFWGILFWVGFSMFFVSYIALGAEVATDYDDRIMLNSYMRVFTLAGALIGTALPLTVIGRLAETGMSPGRAWFLFSLMLALLVFTTVFICWNVTRGCERPVYEERNSQGIAGFLRDARDLLSLKPYRKIILAKMMSSMAYTLNSATLVFYMSFNMKQDPRFASLIYALNSVFSLILVPFIARMTFRFGKNRYMAGAQFTCAGLSFAMALIGVRSRGMLLAYMSIYIFGQASFWQLCNTNLYDITDMDEYKFNQRREGNLMALQSFINIAATSFNLRAYTVLLSLSGFVSSAAEQRPPALSMLKALFLWFPAAGALLAGLFMAGYKVNKDSYALLKEALYRRHQDMPPLSGEEIAKIEEMFR